MEDPEDGSICEIIEEPIVLQHVCSKLRGPKVCRMIRKSPDGLICLVLLGATGVPSSAHMHCAAS